MHPYALYNDQIVPTDDTIWKPGQLGLLSGWGVFSTLRVYEGVPFAFDRHWQRLQHDANLINVNLCFSSSEIEQQLVKLIAVNNAIDSCLRLCVFRSDGGHWEGPGSGNSSDIVVMTNDLPLGKNSLTLGVAQNTRFSASPFAGTKTLSWAHNLTLIENAHKEGFDEAILLNERNEVTECTSANLFAVVNGIAYTPPLTSGPLPGVTRALMLEGLVLPKASVRERVLLLDDLFKADEVFITSTTRELLPVSHILDRAIGSDSHEWPLMNELRTGLQNYIHRYVKQCKNTTTHK